MSFVSRGGNKLDGLLKSGIVEVKDKVCFDIGSSTGGFTDCLLQYGAKKVYCCDVGRNLLHEKLRKDNRVVIFENVNFRYFIEFGLKEKLEEKIDIFTVDVSFISLKKILPVIIKIQKNNSPYYVICLVKPQFECNRNQLKKGILEDKQQQLEMVQKISDFAQYLGFKEIHRTLSIIPGQDGNIEYFLVLKKIITDKLNHSPQVVVFAF